MSIPEYPSQASHPVALALCRIFSLGSMALLSRTFWAYWNGSSKPPSISEKSREAGRHMLGSLTGPFCRQLATVAFKRRPQATQHRPDETFPTSPCLRIVQNT